MSSTSSNPRPTDAADWDSRLRSPLCSEEDRQAFAEWCSQSVENRRAFDQLHVRIRALKDAAPVDPTLRAVVDRATALRQKRGRASLLAAGLAFAAVLAAGGVFMASAALRESPAEVFHTRAGERSTLRLDDGSVVTLNSRSELRVKYGKGVRALTLVAGEALFEVAKEKRPFVVTVGRREVVALGTAFDIRTDARQFRLTMVEGKVNVRPADGARSGRGVLALVAGQQMTGGHDSAAVAVTHIDPGKEIAWLDGRIHFEDEPLTEAVEEINRYATRRIVVGDRSLNRFLINGSFRTGQSDNFVMAVTSYYPIVATTGPQGEVVLSHR